MSTLPNYVFGLQGLLLLANGVYTLLYPKKAAEPGSPMVGTPVPVVHAMSMTSFSLGAFFIQVGYQGNREFMVTAVPMRFFAAAVFGRHGGAWGNVAAYEAAWGAVNIAALMW